MNNYYNDEIKCKACKHPAHAGGACFTDDCDCGASPDYSLEEGQDYWCNCPRCGNHTFENLPDAVLKCVGCGHEF